MPRQHTPQGWPETEVFVRQDMPRSKSKEIPVLSEIDRGIQ